MNIKYQLYRQLLNQYNKTIENIKSVVNEKGMIELEREGFFDKSNKRKSVIERLCKIQEALDKGLDIGQIAKYVVKPELVIYHIDGFEDVVWFHTKHGYYQIEKAWK